MENLNKQNVFEKVKQVLIELFELDAADITLTAHLYTDLDLDSIDAVDLVVYLQNLTGKKIDPEQFQAVRTVEDIVNAVEELL